jgi:hypothetical protein
MRVVVDTNVLVSAALKQKSMPGMTALVVERRGGLLKSLATERQLFEVVARQRVASLIDPETRAWLKKLMAAAELVTIHRADHRVPRSDRRQISGAGGQRSCGSDRQRRRRSSRAQSLPRDPDRDAGNVRAGCGPVEQHRRSAVPIRCSSGIRPLPKCRQTRV